MYYSVPISGAVKVSKYAERNCNRTTENCNGANGMHNEGLLIINITLILYWFSVLVKKYVNRSSQST